MFKSCSFVGGFELEDMFSAFVMLELVVLMHQNMIKLFLKKSSVLGSHIMLWCCVVAVQLVLFGSGATIFLIVAFITVAFIRNRSSVDAVHKTFNHRLFLALGRDCMKIYYYRGLKRLIIPI